MAYNTDKTVQPGEIIVFTTGLYEAYSLTRVGKVIKPFNLKEIEHECTNKYRPVNPEYDSLDDLLDYIIDYLTAEKYIEIQTHREFFIP